MLDFSISYGYKIERQHLKKRNNVNNLELSLSCNKQSYEKIKQSKNPPLFLWKQRYFIH